MPKASIVVPAFNVAATLPETLDSLLAQSFRDFEIIVVDDGSSDETGAIARSYARHPEVRLVVQPNRGLAGARNTGIRMAQGVYVGFCDADDLWHPEKLARHVAHLDAQPEVGISYSGSALIDSDSRLTGHAQKPRLGNVRPADVFRRNPVGNGSAPVIRRAALTEIAFAPAFASDELWFFDETFRQSEDIECWMRIALQTEWRIEGIPGLLTLYRIHGGGLSANTGRQLASWERMVAKLSATYPDFFARFAPAARAYQLRYLARRAITGHDGVTAMQFVSQAMRTSLHPLWAEPFKTISTLVAACMLRAAGPVRGAQMMRLAQAAKSSIL